VWIRQWSVPPNMSQVIIVEAPFSFLYYAELTNGVVRPGPKRDICIYDLHVVPTIPEWRDYINHARITYMYDSGTTSPMNIRMKDITKVTNTGYIIPIVELSQFDTADLNIINDLGAHMNVVTKIPRQPKQCIAPPRAIPSRRNSSDSTDCVYGRKETTKVLRFAKENTTADTIKRALGK
jgi:hypothetical protein